VTLNLAAAGQFNLEIRHSVPAAGGRVSLYFRSGRGWYAAGTALAGDGWQTLRFSKEAFSTEGQPAGWHDIDGIRIAVWREQPRDGMLRVRFLGTVQHDVAVVMPDGEAGSESRAATRTTEDVQEMLHEMGLVSDAVREGALPHGALGDRPVATER